MEKEIIGGLSGRGGNMVGDEVKRIEVARGRGMRSRKRKEAVRKEVNIVLNDV